VSHRYGEKFAEVSKFTLGFYGHPPPYNGHELVTTKNIALKSDDGRLRIHFVLFCDLCRETRTTRGHFPPELTDYPRAVALSKLAAVSRFSEPCDRKA
jgi:hypothetical protein